MKYQHGRGKQSFRDFVKSLNDELRDTIAIIKDGEEITANDVHRFTTRIVNEYIQRLRAEELDVEMWGDRATDVAFEKSEAIIAQFDLYEETTVEDIEDERAEVENEEFDASDTDASDGTLFGFDLLTKENKSLVRAKGKPRKRFFDSLDELQKYIQNVPYILAIQIVKQLNGKVIYRVWVEAAKDQKKKPKSAS